MIALKKSLKYSLAWCLLLLAAGAQATPILIEQGQVLKISSSYVNINDTQFRMSPTVKVKKADQTPGKLIDIKKGDYIEISVEKINKRAVVDSIIILKGP